LCVHTSYPHGINAYKFEYEKKKIIDLTNTDSAPLSVLFPTEVDLDVVPLDVCGVVFGSPYMYMRDEIFMRRAN